MFWNVIAGAVFGPVGLVAAGVATGVAIAVAKQKMGDSEEKAEKRGEQRATAKCYEEVREYKEKARKIHDYVITLKEWDQFGESLIAMSAVGFACANCDGEIHPQEIEEIDEFVAGVNHSKLPSRVKERIGKLRREPPNLNTAFELAKKAEVEPWILDLVIDVVMHADGIVHANEKAFMNAWHKMKSA